MIKRREENGVKERIGGNRMAGTGYFLVQYFFWWCSGISPNF